VVVSPPWGSFKGVPQYMTRCLLTLPCVVGTPLWCFDLLAGIPCLSWSSFELAAGLLYYVHDGICHVCALLGVMYYLWGWILLPLLPWCLHWPALAVFSPPVTRCGSVATVLSTLQCKGMSNHGRLQVLGLFVCLSCQQVVC
jgi:hypothetical protein